MTGNSPDTARPLPSDLQSAGARKGCLECEAWLDRVAEEKAWLGFKSSVDAAGRSETEGAAPASAAPEAAPCPRQPSIRERAFDAAQRLVLSQPHMAIGQIEQNRLADYILQMAERFERWMLGPAPVVVRDAFDKYAWDAATDDACMSGWDGSVFSSSSEPVEAEGLASAATMHSGENNADNSIPARTADAIMGVVIQMAKDIATFEAVANQLDKRRRAL